MSERSAAYSIKAFPGHTSHGLAWTIHKRHLMEMAMMAFPNPQDGMGVLVYLISKGKYVEFYCKRHGCSPDSGEISEISIPIYKRPKIPAVAEYDDSNKGFSKFKMAQEEWIRESSAVQDFRAKLLASLDEIALTAVGTPDQIFSALDL